MIRHLKGTIIFTTTHLGYQYQYNALCWAALASRRSQESHFQKSHDCNAVLHAFLAIDGVSAH